MYGRTLNALCMIVLLRMLKQMRIRTRLMLMRMKLRACWLILPVIVLSRLGPCLILPPGITPPCGTNTILWSYSKEDWMMKSTKKKITVKKVLKDGTTVNVAPCTVYRYRVSFADPAAKDLLSPPYAFASDADAMHWINEMAVRLLDDVKAKFTSITCYCFMSCDDKGVITSYDEKAVGTLTRDDVISAMALKLEAYKNV